MSRPEELYQRILAADAAEVRSWPEWRRHPTLVPRDERRRTQEIPAQPRDSRPEAQRPR